MSSTTTRTVGDTRRLRDADRRPGGRRRSLLRLAFVPVIASLIVLEAVAGGTSSSSDARSVAAILVWWALLMGLVFSLAPRAHVSRAALGTGALLALFALLTALSIAWAPSAERAFLEADRVLLYLGFFLVPVLFARRAEASKWADATALAIVAVAVLGLGQRLFPGVFPDDSVGELLPNAATRLSYPLGYWNGLAIFVALGVPLLLRVAITMRSHLWRGLAVAAIPVIACTIYLTSSRGGVAVAVVAGAAFVVLSGKLHALIALAVSAAGAAAAVAILSAQSPLVDGPLDTAAARDAGLETAPLLLLVCAATGFAYAMLSTRVAARGVPRAVWAVLGVALLAVVIAADPGERVDTFKAPPPVEYAPDAVPIDEHLTSGGGSGRWQFWDAAAEQWTEHPVLGDGAGSYEPWWAQHGSIDWFVRNAHSLWLETLGELGLVGFLLIAAAFGVGMAAGGRRLREHDDDQRVLVAALLALVIGFVLGAAIDWVWQLPAVALLAMLSLGLLVTTTSEGLAGGQARRAGRRVALALCAWGAICAQAFPFLAGQQVEASQDAVDRGDLTEALDRAKSAEAIQPWAASTRLQLALVREELGQIEPAREEIDAAIERDDSDWRLQVVAARLAVKAGDIPDARAALARARALNPRSRLLDDLPAAE